MRKCLSTALSLTLIITLATMPAVAQVSQAEDSSPLIVGLSKQSSPEVAQVLDAAFYSYHVFELDLARINAQVRLTGRLNLHLGNQTFELDLEENDLRSENYRLVSMEKDGGQDLKPGPVTTFRGTVVGDEQSVVRLSVTPELFTGFIARGDEMLVIDPLADFTYDLPPTLAERYASGDVVVYLEADSRELGAGACGTEENHHLGRTSGFHRASQKALNGFDFGELNKGFQFRTLEVALECDGQYRAQFGQNGAINRMMGIMNDVDGVIYRSELNLGINVVFAGCWPNAGSDPYTSLNANTTLNQMANWWNANGNNFAPTRDVTHQFSGKNFSGSTIGIAFVGVICNNRPASVGISQDVSGSASRRRLTAHEIGHNLSANHDGAGANCNGNGPVMCPSIQSGGSSAADDFSNQSLNSIDNHIDTFGSCI